MKHILGMAEYCPSVKAAPGWTLIEGSPPRIEVAILGHSKNDKSSVLFPDGSIKRVATSRLKILIPQYEFSSFNVPVKK